MRDQPQFPATSWTQGSSQTFPHTSATDLITDRIATLNSHTAVICGAQSFSYETLRQYVDFLTDALTRRGTGRGARIGLCMERSFELIAAILASWRCGASWVPLDPRFPADRLEFVARDARLSLVITSGLQQQPFRWPSEQVLTLHSMSPDEIAGLSGGLAMPTAIATDPNDEAYAMYTSGSTGKPKGVRIPQRALANFLQSMEQEPGITHQDRLLAVTTPSFDICVLELLLPLCAGATIVIADQDDVRDGARLLELITSHAVSMLQATASTWRILLDAGWTGSATLKALVGGEPLAPTLGTRLNELCGEVWNMYGPTETTVWSSCWRLPPGPCDQVSLGRPVAHTRIALRDEHMQECPIDTPGEICISGAGVGLGYINRPEEELNRFVRMNSADAAYAVNYRTGDLGQWKEDGTLEFMGRLDQQVKIRGRRIEASEIEERLRAYPLIQDAVVTAEELLPGDLQLVAHIVSTGTVPLEFDALRSFLGAWLPEYMVPQHFEVLGALPLLPNGKVDRNSLGNTRSRKLSASATAFADDMSPTEAAVHRVWCEKLKRQAIGLNENFFDIGGHSLLAAQVAEKLRPLAEVPDRFPLLYRFPTIASLAAALDAGIQSERHQVISLQTAGNLTPVFCIGGIDLFQPLADEFSPDRPVFGVYVESTKDSPQENNESGTWPVTSVNRLALEYVGAIRSQRPRGPYCLVGFSLGGVIAHAVANQLQRDGESIAVLALLDSDAPGGKRRNAATSPRKWLRHIARSLSSDKQEAQDKPLGMTGIFQMLDTHDARLYTGSALFFEAAEENSDTARGWHELTGHLEHIVIPSTHLGLLQAPHVEAIARAIKMRINEQQTPEVPKRQSAE